jgi:flagellar biogenesis protein FliO
MVLAASESAWGGMVVGLIAAAVFVLFSTYIVVQRVRDNRRNRTDD